MDASIDFSGVLKGSIADSGGSGGGDTVIITPVVTSGTKIADVSVNGVEKDLYCPTPPAPTEVDITPVQQSGTKIATIGVNGVNTDLYAPESGGHEYSTTEHVVGVWIDGRPIYEKTFTVITDSNIYYIPNTTDIDHLISISGYANKDNNEFYIPYNDSADYISIAYIENNGMRIYTSIYFVGAQYVINAQYTKSTDAPTR